ncbi:MAG: DUF4268 domain-containing protein, partial [Candidatus Sumerlaeota bacterium]|nr:DUF4268 domain-containing protein [Candidatus Sumerlaeota bacterium]
LTTTICQSWVSLRELWKNEAADFTPWLAENIHRLGEVIGMDLETAKMEKDVGDFSLDILAKDLNTGHLVIIENQITKTDHDHLGKLITYAGSLDASAVVWVAHEIRDEHRQALEWLNRKTSNEVHFFGVVVEVIKIDKSRPAVILKPVVMPSIPSVSPPPSPRADAYRRFFQRLIDELREKHHFTNARTASPTNWYSFSSGVAGFTYAVSFASGRRVRSEVYIDRGDQEENKRVFDDLQASKKAIEKELKSHLQWERLDDKRACRIALYRDGSIDDSSSLDSIHSWAITQMLSFRKVFFHRLKKHKELSQEIDSDV